MCILARPNAAQSAVNPSQEQSSLSAKPLTTDSIHGACHASAPQRVNTAIGTPKSTVKHQRLGARRTLSARKKTGVGITSRIKRKSPPKVQHGVRLMPIALEKRVARIILRPLNTRESVKQNTAQKIWMLFARKAGSIGMRTPKLPMQGLGNGQRTTRIGIARIAQGVVLRNCWQRRHGPLRVR